MSPLNIAFITTDTLLFLGVKNILQNMFSFHVVNYKSKDDFTNDNPDKYDIIISDSASFVANIDFYIPRKNKTIIIANGTTEQSSFYQIDRHADESDIIEAFNNFINQFQSSYSAQSELSQREIEVLKLVASGMINKEIADTLQISINTVLTHRKNITAKLGIRSVSGLSVYAMMNGYLTNL